jgi:hypothetical protein
VLHRRIALLGRGEAHRLRQLWSAHRDPRTRESAGDSGTSARGAGAARLRGTRPQPRRRQFGTGRCRDERPSPRRRCRQPSPVKCRGGPPAVRTRPSFAWLPTRACFRFRETTLSGGRGLCTTSISPRLQEESPACEQPDRPRCQFRSTGKAETLRRLSTPS